MVRVTRTRDHHHHSFNAMLPDTYNCSYLCQSIFNVEIISSFFGILIMFANATGGGGGAAAVALHIANIYVVLNLSTSTLLLLCTSEHKHTNT